ncbi:MAG TPA: tetratricopeptide repeat protein [Hyphomicrobium sp.]|nr:tetratricopeptide repeat protein [Hyphomicrobium sp.]
MANQDENFLREVEEELRRERFERIWKEYGTFILAGAALIVIGVLGYKYVENRRLTAAQTTGQRYEGAVDLASSGKDGSAEKEFAAIVAEGTGGYPELARLQLAGVLLKQGKKADAIAAYDELAKSGTDPLLRDYAALQAAGARLGEADFTEMQNRLTPLMADTSPWRYSARGLLGVAAFKAGKPDEARTVLTPLLVDQKTPPSIAERAQIVLAEIAAAEIGKKAAAEPIAPGAPAPAVISAPDAVPPPEAKQ